MLAGKSKVPLSLQNFQYSCLRINPCNAIVLTFDIGNCSKELGTKQYGLVDEKIKTR